MSDLIVTSINYFKFWSQNDIMTHCWLALKKTLQKSDGASWVHEYIFLAWALKSILNSGLGYLDSPGGYEGLGGPENTGV